MATLILEDGSRFEGTLFGRRQPATGEVVFMTGMSGYQETLTDPAYRGQIVCMTYPLIGNVGVSDLDFESGCAQAAGLVVSELCELPSSWQMSRTLDEFLSEQGVTGICGVDTRALTRHIRDNGVMRGRIVDGEATEEELAACRAFALHGEAIEASCRECYDVSTEGDVRIAVLDLGMKRSLTSRLVKQGAQVSVFPALSSAQEILESGCDGVLISAGPGNPEDYPQIVKTVEALMAAKPVMGVGLGHLLMALASGCRVERMRFGHHGSNQPVKDLAAGTCAVTGQSHLYAVSGDALPEGVRVSHVNWNDRSIEGLTYEGREAFSVQFIPSGLGGPFDTTILFDNFLKTVRASRERTGA